MAPVTRSSSRLSLSSPIVGFPRSPDDDLKSAVKVVVRVRPPLKPSDSGYHLIPERFRRSVIHDVTSTSLSVGAMQGNKVFVFDRIFSTDVDQGGVWQYLGDSVKHFIEGYNVSILAYGQSGSGKSYTMGTAADPSDLSDSSTTGIIPRAAKSLFEFFNDSKSPSKTITSGLKSPRNYSLQPSTTSTSSSKPDRIWSLKATYLEIYNEQLRDLLIPDTVPPSERPQVSIREDPKGRILLTGLRQVPIKSLHDLLSALSFGSSIRQTDSTAVNAKSSRSHAIFSLYLQQSYTKNSATTTTTTTTTSSSFEPPSNSGIRSASVSEGGLTSSETTVTTESKLHFVDLAGSERLKHTGAQGDRAKEGISINSGLASLGKVISQLSSRTPGMHVSYRDSRITRLLQDSLGGEALTYMIACINPAEFHISETLNTLQYAQRARAIQSKPLIQQSSHQSDLQSVIQQLRAEVSHLRNRLATSEKSMARCCVCQEGLDSRSERFTDLQNQLLDVQENYNALSERHSKLIAQLARYSDLNEIDSATLDRFINSGTLDRVKKFSSTSEAVGQLIQDYEKTIQSLESSLSSTRLSLSNSEGALLEKESRITYLETVAQNTQVRLQKSMDREASDEKYLQNLEANLKGLLTGEEKSNDVIKTLKTELTRFRESQSSCEEYIASLELQVAEAERDQEVLQREIRRLKRIVDRQRTISKLDNFGQDFSSFRLSLDDSPLSPKSKSPGRSGGEPNNGSSSPADEANFNSHANVESVSTDDTTKVESSSLATSRSSSRSSNDRLDNKSLAPQISFLNSSEEVDGKLTQSNYVADKLETVTQELFDLRVEHESVLNDYDEVCRKYKVALRALAEIQDANDEGCRSSERLTCDATTPRSTCSLPNLDSGPPSDNCNTFSAYRLLSDDLATVCLDPINIEEKSKPSFTSITKTAVNPSVPPSPKDISATAVEVDKLKRLNDDKDQIIIGLKDSYAQLQEQYRNSLDCINDLKTEVKKTQLLRNSSPSPSKIIRRKLSPPVIASDRSTRCFASLRQVALDNLSEKPEAMQSFELNLNSLMTEMLLRSERVATLEAELTAVQKEMESKTTLISGLTRERSSFKASTPLDISVVSAMHDQLVETENQIRTLQATHATRESQLIDEINALKKSVSLFKSEESTESIRGGTITSSLEDGSALTTQESSRLVQLVKLMENRCDNQRMLITDLTERYTFVEKNISQSLKESACLVIAREKVKQQKQRSEKLHSILQSQLAMDMISHERSHEIFEQRFQMAEEHARFVQNSITCLLDMKDGSIQPKPGQTSTESVENLDDVSRKICDIVKGLTAVKNLFACRRDDADMADGVVKSYDRNAEAEGGKSRKFGATTNYEAVITDLEMRLEFRDFIVTEYLNRFSELQESYSKLSQELDKEISSGKTDDEECQAAIRCLKAEIAERRNFFIELHKSVEILVSQDKTSIGNQEVSGNGNGRGQFTLTYFWDNVYEKCSEGLEKMQEAFDRIASRPCAKDREDLVRYLEEYRNQKVSIDEVMKEYGGLLHDTDKRFVYVGSKAQERMNNATCNESSEQDTTIMTENTSAITAKNRTGKGSEPNDTLNSDLDERLKAVQDQATVLTNVISGIIEKEDQATDGSRSNNNQRQAKLQGAVEATKELAEEIKYVRACLGKADPIFDGCGRRDASGGKGILKDTKDEKGLSEVQENDQGKENDVRSDDRAVGCDELENRVEHLQKKYEESQAKLRKLEDSHAELKESRDESITAHQTMLKEVEGYKEKVKNLEQQIELKTGEVERLVKEQEGIEKKFREVVKESDLLEKAKEKLSNELRETKVAFASQQDQLIKEKEQREQELSQLNNEVKAMRNERKGLFGKVSAVMGKEVVSDEVGVKTKSTVEEKSELKGKEEALRDLAKLKTDLDKAECKVKELKVELDEVKSSRADAVNMLQQFMEKEQKNSRLIEELEEQLNMNFDEHLATNKRLSELKQERKIQLQEVLQAKMDLERELKQAQSRIACLEAQFSEYSTKLRSSRTSNDSRDEGIGQHSKLRKSMSHASLPSPPPAIPLPPIPNGVSMAPGAMCEAVPSPPTSRHQSKEVAHAHLLEDQEARIKSIEKHLYAEKQLTATLEEALTDLETSNTEMKVELEVWRRKYLKMEEELTTLRKERNASRLSVQQLEEEQRNTRLRIEAERANLEARMAQLATMNRKKKKSLNCF